jgi:hypothetical protein
MAADLVLMAMGTEPGLVSGACGHDSSVELTQSQNSTFVSVFVVGAPRTHGTWDSKTVSASGPKAK